VVGEVCCGLADPVDCPAPSAHGEGMPFPPLEVDGGGCRYHGGVGPLSAGGERELGPHTRGVRSELREGLGAS
jgi:hypothetical protein